MGQSASARLVYGVHVKNGYRTNPFWWSEQDKEWGGFENESYDNVEDLGEYLALRSGVANPYQVASADENYDEYEGWAEGTEPEGFDEATTFWYAEQRRLEEGSPIELIRVGSDDEPDILLTIKNHEFWATWDEPLKIETLDLLVPPEMKIDACEMFCKNNDLFPFENPCWILGASYG